MKRVFLILVIGLICLNRLEAQEESRSMSFDIECVKLDIPINFFPPEPNYENETKAGEIFGNWVKIKVTYNNGAEISDINGIKYRNLWYKFRRSNKLFINTTPLFFQVNNDTLNIKNSVGFITNSFLIHKLTNNELVIIEKGKTGFTDNDCIKYYFSKEKNYLNQIPLKSSDIKSINNTDTVYRCGLKIHPKFINDKSFYDYWLRNTPENNNLADSSFLATFIVRKTGLIDNVVVFKKINKQFEKRFLKALKETKDSWLPGELDDKKVDVQVEISFKFRKIDKDKFASDYSNKGDLAVKSFDYAKALEYYNLVLEISPNDRRATYYKAICEIKLGNRAAACETLEKVNSGGLMNVDELIEKNCKEK